ncbi:MAG: hypothetical protein ACFWT7_00170 [Succiniclasticum sp.]
MKNAYIIAPAGHGKTEMIVDIVKRSSQKILVLTHTNAGVYALNKRFRRHGVGTAKYSVYTIASFCRYWCRAYPCTSGFTHADDLSLDREPQKKYPLLYGGTTSIFKCSWAGEVLSESYSAVIVDEYQDCLLAQQSIFVEMNKYIKVWVLGDPLQGIFGWAGELVDWQNMPFEEFKIDTYPWRWENTNKALGQYLQTIRSKLLHILDGTSETLDLMNKDDVIRLVEVDTHGRQFNLQFNRVLSSVRSYYRSVLVITAYPYGQIELAKKIGPIFQMDDPLSSQELADIVQKIDETCGYERIMHVIDFLSNCATYVHSNLKSYESHLKKGNIDFSKIRSWEAIKPFITEAVELDNLSALSDFMSAFYREKNNPNAAKTYKIYRTHLFFTLKRVIDYAADNSLSCNEALARINGKGSYLTKEKSPFLISRTVLCKGLEAECVVVVDPKNFTPKDLYVAMTRATRMIYIVLNSVSVGLSSSAGPRYAISLKRDK